MGRELQKKKNRSSVPKIKMKPKSKRINPLGNAIVAANWNSAETLSQNYRRLGLASKLNSVTGGTELRASKTSTAHKLAITSAIPTVIAPTEARVERDPETGKILRVIHADSGKRENPLNDALLTDDEDDEMEGFGGEQNEIVRELEEQSRMVAEKRVRKQSQREQEWVQRLVEKYGEDTAKMARDRKLNPMQQTQADIGRRLAKWKSEKEI